MKLVCCQVVFVIFVCLAIFSPIKITAQAIVSNTDESKVPPYTLPDPLIDKDGKKITTAAAWTNQQRPYIYHLFEENVYGRFPLKKIPLKFEVRETNNHAFNNLAIRKQVRIYFNPAVNTAYLDLLIYLPANAKAPVPVFTGYNFNGNHTVMPDAGIFLATT